MTDFTISLAGKHIHISANFEASRQYCRKYLSEEAADFSVAITQEDIAYERRKSAREDEVEGLPPRHFADYQLEVSAIYRKIVKEMMRYDTLLVHGSAIAVDSQGYMFTAKSGTGKSTHTRLWREYFGDRAYMVNDDKPLLKIAEDGVTVCGTPWNGKHNLGTNAMVPLKGLCILERGAENSIRRISVKEALPTLMQQCQRPADPVEMAMLLGLLDKMLRVLPVYRLRCNMSLNAVEVSYQGMQDPVL